VIALLATAASSSLTVEPSKNLQSYWNTVKVTGTPMVGSIFFSPSSHARKMPLNRAQGGLFMLICCSFLLEGTGSKNEQQTSNKVQRTS
jgi:hypothetical protein